MSIAQQAARGVAWNIFFGVGSRLLQLLGTLVLTRFIAPDAYGAVLSASIAVITAGISTSFAFGQYLIAHQSNGRVAFQAMVVHVVLGLVTMATVVTLRGPISSWFGDVSIAEFIPGFAAAHILDRLRYVPERVLTRELRFRVIATINGAAEIVFTIVSLVLVRNYGATAIMIATVGRAAFSTSLFFIIAPREHWFVVTPLERRTVHALLGYGTPIMLTTISDHAASRLDSIVVAKLFGPGVMACYNLSYSLAEIPVTNIAGNIAEVLMPSYSKMADRERAPAVVKSAALMTLVVAPLGVGLGAVAPTIVAAFFNNKWALMAPMLMILSIMTIFRPIYWPALAYLQALRQTQLIMWLSIARAVVIIGLVALFGLFGGPLWSCVGACIGYALHSILIIVATGFSTGMHIRPYLIGVARPLLLCIPMFLASVALGSRLGHYGVPQIAILVAQVAAGVLVYVAAAFLFARQTTLTILNLAADAAGRRLSTPLHKSP